MEANEYFKIWCGGYAFDANQVEDLMKEFARIKCQELLDRVIENAKIRVEVKDISAYATLEKTTYEREGHGEPDCETTVRVDKDSILKAVDLNKFIK